MIYLLAKLAGVFIFNFLYRVKVKDMDNVPLKGRVILAAGHVSFLDPMVIFHISPRRVRSVVAKRVMNIWWLGWVLKGTGCVPTNGSSKSTLAVLDNEEEVLIFPEGRCEIKPGNMLPAHTGVAVFALKTGAPVVPVYVKGTFEAWPIGNIFPRFFKRLEARFGPAILFEKVNMEVIPRDTLSQATDKIMEEIKKLNA